MRHKKRDTDRERGGGRRGAVLMNNILLFSFGLLEGIRLSSDSLCLCCCYFKSSMPTFRSMHTQSKQRVLGWADTLRTAEGRMKGVRTPHCSGTCCTKLFYLAEASRFGKTTGGPRRVEAVMCVPPNLTQSRRMKVIFKCH